MITKMSTERILYALKSAAELLSISVRAIDYYIAQHLLETRRSGSRVLITRASLLSFARKDHPFPVAGAHKPKTDGERTSGLKQKSWKDENDSTESQKAA